MEGSTAMTIATLISTITEIFTASIGWVGTVAETVGEQPLLLFGFALGFIGVGVGLFRRLTNV